MHKTGSLFLHKVRGISEVGGVSPTGKSAFVFVRAMRACERAKLCVGALDSDSPPARPGELKMSSGAHFVAEVFVTYCCKNTYNMKSDLQKHLVKLLLLSKTSSETPTF